MADPARLQLLAQLITHPSGQPTVFDLADLPDGGAPGTVREHLEKMVAVGLVAPVGFGDRTGYRPTHDALTRFGGAAISRPSTGGRPEIPPVDHRAQLERIRDELSLTYQHVLSVETVGRYVQDSYDLLAERATVRRFLPALTARFAAERLAAIAAERGSGPGRDVLFVCVRNAGRSQIAAALLRHLAGTQIQVRTAGSTASAAIDPGVRAALARRGLGELVEFPRPLTDDVVRASSVVITMGCGDACPVIPGRRYLDWPVPDPVGRNAREIAIIIDDIEIRVRELLAELLP